MAKELNYTHANGTTYEDSYWKITALSVDVMKRLAVFTFTGYKNQEARLALKEPIGRRIVRLEDDIFDLYFQKVTLKEKNPQEVGYVYCVEFKDIEVWIDSVNENGDSIRTLENQSFFKDSIDA